MRQNISSGSGFLKEPSIRNMLMGLVLNIDARVQPLLWPELLGPPLKPLGESNNLAGLAIYRPYFFEAVC